MSLRRARLSSADAAWLHMDRPTQPDGDQLGAAVRRARSSWERLPRSLRGAWSSATRASRERVRREPPAVARRPLGAGPGFDARPPLHRRGLPRGRATRPRCGSWSAISPSVPLDRGKPLWDMYLVDGPGPRLRGDRAHAPLHRRRDRARARDAVADRLRAAARRRRARARADAPARACRRSRRRRCAGRRRPLRRRSARPASRSATDATSPARSRARRARRSRARRRGSSSPPRLSADARALAKLAVHAGRRRDASCKGELGAARAVAWSRPLALERVKAIAHAQDATVNDVLLAAVTRRAAARTCSAGGEQPREIRAIVPFNLRPLDEPIPRELGNRFGLVFLTLPVDRAEPARAPARAQAADGRDQALARGPGLLRHAGGDRGSRPPPLESRIVDIFSAKASAVMTNVPGPRETVYLAGAPLRAVLVWAPTAGSVGTSVSIFSYTAQRHDRAARRTPSSCPTRRRSSSASSARWRRSSDWRRSALAVSARPALGRGRSCCEMRVLVGELWNTPARHRPLTKHASD